MLSMLGFGCSEPVAPEFICIARAGVGREGQIAVWLEGEYRSNVCSALYLSLRKWPLCGLKNTMEVITRLNLSPFQSPLGILAKLYVLPRKPRSRTPPVPLPTWGANVTAAALKCSTRACKGDSRYHIVVLHTDPTSLSQDETAGGQIKCRPASCADHRFALCQATKSGIKCVSPFFSIGHRVSRKCPQIHRMSSLSQTPALSSFVLNLHGYFTGKLSIRDQ